MVEKSDVLFSAGYGKENPAKWGVDIAEAFEELQRIVGEVQCLRWNDQYVAAAFSLPVDLPTRGPVGGVDIRVREPVLVVFSRRDYPERAPMARSDRKDFPVESLAHLNPTEPGQPAWLCLHRGSVDDWFAENTLKAFIKRMRDWLRDAARDRLIRSTDFFEPTRIVKAAGTAVLSPKDLKQWIARGWQSISDKAGYGFMVMGLLNPDGNQSVHDGFFPVRAYGFHLKSEDLSGSLESVHRINEIVGRIPSASPWCFGLLCWTRKEIPINEYFGHLPGTVAELMTFCAKLDIPLQEALREYSTRKLCVASGIPIILAVLRPRPLINSDSHIEPLSFVVAGSGSDFTETGQLPDSAQVWPLAHRTPLTPEAARQISGLDESDEIGRVLLFGSGALGSKIGLHLGRSGNTAITTVDHDTVSPHNMVRHSLLPGQIGQNKAMALRRSIEAMFEEIPKDLAPVSYSSSALEWLKGDLKRFLDRHSLLVDATASGMILEAMLRADFPSTLKVTRAGIADLGRVGILAIEGPRRNPRIDDLNMFMIDLATREAPLRKWLQREREQIEEGIGARLESITIGMGCASDTMRLADDVVSWHASAFSLALRDLCARNRISAKGILVINYKPEDDRSHRCGALVSQRIPIDPVAVARSLYVKGWRAQGKDSWEIRIAASVTREMRLKLNIASPRETGGLMIGVIHSKRRIIYVTGLIDAPADSEGAASWFYRGTLRLPEAVNEINHTSGGLLGYVGDWHTHPRGSGRISPTDVLAMMKTKRQFDVAGLPTFILIVSHKALNAYVSSPS